MSVGVKVISSVCTLPDDAAFDDEATAGLVAAGAALDEAALEEETAGFVAAGAALDDAALDDAILDAELLGATLDDEEATGALVGSAALDEAGAALEDDDAGTAVGAGGALQPITRLAMTRTKINARICFMISYL